MKLLNFIKSHSNWEELLTNEPYNLKVSRDGDYVMFKYDQIASDFNIPLVREARGIIFYEPTWECVCRAFNKFGNYGESYCPEIDWETATVQEKVDGSLIKVWCHNGSWRVSTNGTIDAFNAELSNNLVYSNFGELFMAAFGKYVSLEDWDKIADKATTYMFELVSPYNRVVIPYEEIDCYFIGWRDNINGKEIDPTISIISDCFPMPKHYPLHSLEDVQRAADALPWDKEGYVVCDGHFNRVKIKSPQYVMAHYARTSRAINEERLIEVVLAGEQKEFCIYASDYAEELAETEVWMHKVAARAVEGMLKTVWGAQNEYSDRGEFAREVLKQPKYAQDFMFHCFEDKIFWDYAKNWTPARWLKAIHELKGE